MRYSETLIIAAAILLFAGSGVMAADLFVSGPVTISVDTTFDSIIVQNGGVLTADALVNVIENMHIESGGVVTHSQRLLTGLRLDVGGTLLIDGSIDVSTKGLLGGTGSSSPYKGETYDPVTGDVLWGTPEVAGGSYGGLGGGGYSPIYGSEIEPNQLGSGGGSGRASSGMYGGKGGGAVFITADAITVNGSITANGQNGSSSTSGGGGSGGTIRLTVGTLSGAGQLLANGGRSGNGLGSGGGGGGRIAITYDNFEFTGAYQARGGVRYSTSSRYSGTAGTVYFKDKAEDYGDLIIDNGNITGFNHNEVPLLDSLGARTFRTVEVKNYGRLQISEAMSPFQVIDSTSILSSGALYLRANSGLNSPVLVITSSQLVNYTGLIFGSSDDLRIDGGSSILNQSGAYLELPWFDESNFTNGSLTSSGQLYVLSDSLVIGTGVTLALSAGSDLNGDSTLTQSRIIGTLQSDIPLQIIGDLVVESGGVVTHSQRLLTGLRLDVGGTLLIDGSIDVSTKGLLGGPGGSGNQPGESYNPVTGAIIRGTPEVAGGSHGGLGGSGYSPIYGSETDPWQLGSGGGGGDWSSGQPGGDGGGAVLIDAAVLIVNGSIRVNGEQAPGPSSGGGGAGGSINLSVGELSGSGQITANGGNALTGSGSGGGGGGRIAVKFDVSDFSGMYKAKGGSKGGGSYSGTAGTIYLKDKAEDYGDLIIDNGNITGFNHPEVTLLDSLGARTFRTVEVKNYGRLQISEAMSPFQVIDSLRIENAGIVVFDGNYDQHSGLLYVGSASVLQCDTASIEEDAILEGFGQIVGTVYNNGITRPGTSVGELTVTGNMHMQDNHTLQIEIGGLQSVDQHDLLSIEGSLELNGGLSIDFINYFEPIVGDSFSVLSYYDRIGTFDLFEGIDTTRVGVWYRDESVVLVIDSSEIVATQDLMILSPAGNVPFVAILTDVHGNPVPGSNDIWLDFSTAHGVVGCMSEMSWPFVYPGGVSGLDGTIRFWPNAGGCTDDSVTIRTSHGIIGKVPLKSFDRNASLSVTPYDFKGDICNDYNSDGVTNATDWDIFINYIDITCIDAPANYIGLTPYTDPPSGHIFQGDIIDVCVKLKNTAPVDMIIDSVVFYHAGYGIHRSWTQFGEHYNVQLHSGTSLNICEQFTYPPVGHLCFKVVAYAEYSDNNLLMTTMSSDSLVYGFYDDNGEEWAFIGISNGQTLNMAKIYPETIEIDYSSLKLLGLTAEQHAGLNAAEAHLLSNVLSSPLCATAATLWETGFAEYIDTPRDTALRALSGLLLLFRDLVNLRTGDTKITQSNSRVDCDCDPTPNGCGPDGWMQYVIPDFQIFGGCIHECCNDHDRAYCSPNGGSEYDRLVADVALGDCIRDCPFPGPQVWDIYQGAVMEEGKDYFCREDPLPPDKKEMQMNTDARPNPNDDGDGDGIPDSDDPCPQTAPGCRAVAFAFGGCAPGPSFGCPHGDLPLSSSEPNDVGVKSKLLEDIYPFFIPLGDAIGDTIYISYKAFLPEGWNLELSDTGTFITPDTIFGIVHHPAILNCDDTGRVVFSGLTGNGEYAGMAEAAVFVRDDSASIGTPLLITPSDNASDVAQSAPLIWHWQANARWYRIQISTDIEFETAVIIDSTMIMDTVLVVDSLASGIRHYWHVSGVNCDGNGSWSETWSFIPGTAVNADDASRELPYQFAIHQNYPNPFNPTTEIHFMLPKNSPVQLEIYNIMGQKVATLLNCELKTGFHTVTWDGTADNGENVATGIYFYRIEAGDYSDTKKMMLLK